MLALAGFFHFVFTCVCVAREMTDIRDIYDLFYFIPRDLHETFQSIRKYIRAQVSYMGIVVNRRPAVIHANFRLSKKTTPDWRKFFFFSGEGIIKLDIHILV